MNSNVGDEKETLDRELFAWIWILKIFQMPSTIL